ncbi:hypothetical protein ABW20_dc0106915 [Dactylellina cionopaga]|nr:hypothetical protein ABW20_dc0106915 [Dactylellina cionopaga]
MTLGGQYNWTTKEYPDESSIDSASLASAPLDAPEPKAQPRKKKKGKIEAPPPPPPIDQHTLIIRIRSGDAIVMGGDSRWAWHGVPKVIGDTCPEELYQWPNLATADDSDGQSVNWNGWMKRKRVNLNIRQMYEHAL